jgi:hypothetical protein
MIKNNVVALAVAAFAVCAGLALAGLSPVSANSASYATSTGYFPDEFVNQAKEIEPAIDTHGDIGLPKAFPKQSVDSMIDSTPEMYS